MARTEKGRRRSAGRVSGWRSANHAKAMAAMAKNVVNIARQLPSQRITCPRAGATVGTRMNTAIAKDIRRAICRPSYWSRTRATVTMRGPATPIPCRTRPTIIVSKVGAKMLTRHPIMNRTRPAWMAGLRPMRSESGPKSIWPSPSPTNRDVMTNWTSFGRGASRSRPIAGSAGSIASIASATSDIRRAMRGTNSPGRRAGPLAAAAAEMAVNRRFRPCRGT